MAEQERAGEVIQACTTDFTAQCYELYQIPPLGSLVKTRWDEKADLYGVVCRATTAGIEPGRRPIARGKDETDEEQIYHSSPQLLKLLRSEFAAAVIGYKVNDTILQCLPPKPARIHSFVYLCSDEEVKTFSQSFVFLNVLLKSSLELPVEELVSASLRRMSQVWGGEKRAFLVSAGKELASLLSRDYGQLKAILRGLKNDAN
ncbi:MAG TPA: hypothetical protein VLH15_05415 [Dehalococcoidales bacterium]|nr:hypothetical protein [Dehalococcoidales bacterium]